MYLVNLHNKNKAASVLKFYIKQFIPVIQFYIQIHLSQTHKANTHVAHSHEARQPSIGWSVNYKVNK